MRVFGLSLLVVEEMGEGGFSCEIELEWEGASEWVGRLRGFVNPRMDGYRRFGNLVFFKPAYKLHKDVYLAR